MLLVIFLTGAILWNLPWSKYENVFLVSAVEPGYLDFDNLPDTNFSCEGKVIGGYYADVETGCQMFHVCTIGQKSEISDIKFLCLNGTVFDQETRVCERLDEVDCSKSESFFDLNLELYGNGGGFGIQPEDEIKESEDEQVTCEDEYEDELNCKKSDTDQKQNTMNTKGEMEYEWEEANAALSTTPASASSTTSSTTTAKQIQTSARPSPPPSQFHYRPEAIPISTTTQNAVVQLLALHEAFQENQKRREPQSKFRPSAPLPQKNASSTKTPAYPPYQLSNVPQSHYTAHSNKLPNSLSNLSQNVHFTHLPPNRGPPPPAYKPEPTFYNKQHSQKVANKSVTFSTSPKTEPLYAYKILSNDPSNRFRTPQTGKPAIATETFKESVPRLAHSTFTIAQNRPYIFRPKMLLDDAESDSETEEQQAQQKIENFSHTNFARAIPDRPAKNSSDTISVVLSTSSVSSSVSSKPRSAISNNANSVAVSNPSRSFVSNSTNSLSTKLKDVPPLTLTYPNITDINESLTEEAYYEETRTDYDDNFQEYKDFLYQTDVQKIKHK